MKKKIEALLGYVCVICATVGICVYLPLLADCLFIGVPVMGLTLAYKEKKLKEEN